MRYLEAARSHKTTPHVAVSVSLQNETHFTIILVMLTCDFNLTYCIHNRYIILLQDIYSNILLSRYQRLRHDNHSGI